MLVEKELLEAQAEESRSIQRCVVEMQVLIVCVDFLPPVDVMFLFVHFCRCC